MNRISPLFAALFVFAFSALTASGVEIRIFNVDWQSDQEVSIYLIDPGGIYFSGDASFFSAASSGLRYDTHDTAPSDIKYNTQVRFFDRNNTELNYASLGGLPDYIKITIWIERQEWSIWNLFSGGFWKTTKEYNKTLYVYRDRTSPVVTVSGGPGVTNAASVTLTASGSDTGSGLNQASYYSINGGALQSGNTVTLTGEGAWEVTFFMRDNVGNITEKTERVSIDRTAPGIGISGGTGSGWAAAAEVVVSASATDAVSGVNAGTWQRSTDGGASWSSQGAAYNRMAFTSEGVHSVRFRVTDYAGNTRTSQDTAARIDRTVPQLTLSGNVAWTSAASHTVSVSAADALSGIALITTSQNNGATWQDEASKTSASKTFTAEGRSPFTFRALDNAGNSTSASGTVNIDRTPPVIANFTAPGGWVRPGLSFSGVTVKDSTAASASVSGVNPESIQVSAPGFGALNLRSSYNTGTGTLNTFTVSGLPNGTYNLTLSAADYAGNGVSSVIQNLKVDGTGPAYTVGLNGVPRRSGTGWTIPLVLSGVEDEHSGVDHLGWKYAIDDGAETGFAVTGSGKQYSANIALGSLSGGAHLLKINVKDNAGNVSAKKYDFTVDDVPPALSYDPLFAASPDAAAWTNRSDFSTGAADSGSGMALFSGEIRRQQNDAWVSTGDAAFNKGAITFSPGTPDGVFQILLLAEDRAGNQCPAVLYVKVDRGPPVLTLPSGISGSGSISAQASDAFSGVDESSWEWKGEDGIWRQGKTAELSPGKDRRFGFRVRDRAGNSVEKTGELTVDTSPPRVSAATAPFAVRDRLRITALDAEDGISGVSRVWYRVDDGEARTVSPWPIGVLEIPLEAYPEGRRGIQFGAEDAAGNTGTSGVCSFIIDRSPPVIESVEIREPGREDGPPGRSLGDYDFTAALGVSVKSPGTDLYRDGDEAHGGSVIAWYWDIRQNKGETPVFQESRKSAVPEFTLQGYEEGINYLYVRGEDAGGNLSESVRRTLSLDRSIPGAPVIRSGTHEEASRPEQAGFLGEAEFRFRPAGHIRSGVEAYLWQLKRVHPLSPGEGPGEILMEGRVEDLDAESGAFLSLALEDNRENEFYRLSVRCLGGNGLSGAAGEYQFRIDTTAPNEVRVRANPQLNPALWYHDRDALILWNKPADMTGVAEYRYRVRADEDPSGEEADQDLSGWIGTADTEARVNLKAILGDRAAGTLYISVCAIDYAGNRRFGYARIQCDYRPPYFETEGPQPLLITGGAPGEPEGLRRVLWGRPGDGESGVERLTLTLTGEDRTWSYTPDPQAGEFTLEQLGDRAAYTVLVRAYDYAGNTAELSQVFATGGAPLPESYRIPYRESLNGFELSGDRIVNTGSSETTGYADLRLLIPPSVNITEIRTSGGIESREGLSQLFLEDITVDSQLPRTGRSREGLYEAEAGGFVVRGSKVVFDREQGVSLGDGIYTRPLVVDGFEAPGDAALGNTSLGVPPVPRFSGGPGALKTPAAVKTLGEDQDGGFAPGFPVGGIEGIRLGSGKEWFVGTALSANTRMLAERGIILSTREGGFDIPLGNAGLQGGSKNLEAETAPGSPLCLILGGLEYTVTRAGIRGYYVDIYEALLELPETCEPRSLVLRNFILDGRNGAVYMGPDFSAGNMRIQSPGGSVWETSVIEFDLEGRLLLSGLIDSNVYGVMGFSGLELTREGVDWERGGRIRGFTAMVHGFALSAADARFTREGIFIEEGTIGLYGAPRRFINLGLADTGPDEVYATGEIGETYYAPAGYGNPLAVAGGTIEPGGVYGTVLVPPNPAVTGPAEPGLWEFAHTRLYPSGAMAGSLAQPRQIEMGGHPLTAGDILFTGDELILGSVFSDPIPGLDGGTLEFKDLVFNEDTILAPGTAEGAHVFRVSGWTVTYDRLNLDRPGIGGEGILSGRQGSLAFPESMIGRDGSFTSGKAAAGTVEIGGIPLGLTEAALVSREGVYVLHCANPVLSLKNLAGPELYFGETLFDAAGNVLSCAGGTERVKFVSANGYRLDSGGYFIDNSGIGFEGSIGALWWDDETLLAGENIRLLPGYDLTGAAARGEAPYHHGDWQFSGGDVSFGQNQISLGYNHVVYRNVKIPLGRAVFDSRGSLSQEVIVPQDLELPLVLGLSVTLRETRLSRDGLEAGITIRLPDFLGGRDLNFDSLRLGADGMFRVEKPVEDLGFSVGETGFSLRGLTMDSAGIYAASAELTLPEAQEKKALALKGLRITGDSLTLEDAAIDPFTMWGMAFLPRNLSITQGRINISGALELPESMPGVLSGRSCEIREFTLGFDGAVYAFDASLDGTCTIPFLETWTLSINSPRAQYLDGQPWITMDNAVLGFPEGYAAAGAVIDRVRFNPLTGAFDYDALRVEGDIALSLGGVDLILNQLRIDSTLTVGFSGSARFPARGLPGFIAGKSAVIDGFEIRKDGSLGNIAVSLEGLEGEILPGFDGLLLKNGRASLIKSEGRSLALSVSGDILLTAAMPEPFAGSALVIEDLSIDPAIPAITRFQARVSLADPVLFGNQFTRLAAGIRWDQDLQTGCLDLSGFIKLPGSFPSFLAGKEAAIRNFTIGFDGGIQALEAEYASEPGRIYEAFGALQLTDAEVAVSLNREQMAFDLAGTVILPEGKFPQGIGGSRTRIRMKFDTLAGLVYASGSLSLNTQRLFNSLELRNFGLSISMDAGTPLQVSAAGQLLLPENFPQGLRGMAVDIRRFTMDSSGGITEFDVGLSGVNTGIFGLAELKNGAMGFRLGEKDELILGVEGTVRLNSPGLPQVLRDTELRVNTLEVSTKYGLRSFEVGLGASLSFSILGGLQVAVNSLLLDESSITLNAGISLPASYPEGLANTRIDLKVLKLRWDGGIADIQGGLGAASFTLAGFTTRIQQLYFEKDAAGKFWVTLKSCRLYLPSNIGSLSNEYVGIKNARFSPENGSFVGDIEAPSLVTEIAGFILELKNPGLEISRQRIYSQSAAIRTPDFLGGTALTLKGVTLSLSGGLSLEGGGVKLPSFNAGGLRFSNVEVNIVPAGSECALGGGGSVFIPGAGTIDAALSFTNKSSAYPLGIRQAEFSYTLAAGGIPLGASGLFLNGITGGITYGPPDELPRKVRGMFESQGPRIKLGLHVGDAYGGSILDMSPTAWVDITNAAWAFQGKAVVLRGKLDMTAELTAALNTAGFYAGAEVELKFVRGGVDMYIYSKSGKTVFSGEGFVQFGLSKGAILDTTVAFVPIQVPPGDIWLGGVNASFGQFSNGKTGFKGTVELPLLGEKGVFAAPGQFVIGDVSAYQVEKPSWAPSSLRGSRLVRENPGVISGDAADRQEIAPLVYQVWIPPLPGEDAAGETGLERIVFILAYTEGDPALTASAPSGAEYREGSLKTEMVFMENILALIVHAPEAGVWNIRVDNIGEDFFELNVLGGGKAPGLAITEPAHALTPVSGAFLFRGNTDVKNGTILVHAREGAGKPGRELGTYSANEAGYFEAEVPVEELPDGEYVISAQFLTQGTGVSPVVYASGKILVDRSGMPLNVPGGLRVAETDPGILTLNWRNTNGGRGLNYKLRIRSFPGTEELVFTTGNITTLTLPEYETGQRLSFEAAALDGSGGESPYSPPVYITLGLLPPEINRPQTAAGPIVVEVPVGGFAEGLIPVKIGNYRAAENPTGYILARETGRSSPDLGQVFFGGPLPVEGEEAAIPWHAGIAGTISPGTYTLTGEVVNEANGSLSAPFSLEFRIHWPAPEIYALEPAEVNGREETRIRVHGSGLMPGTRVFWRGEELSQPAASMPAASLPAAEGGFSPAALDFLLPPQTEPGTCQVTLAGPDGQTASFPLTVLLPDWNITLYTRSAETLPGGSLSYALGVTGLNGFDGAGSFTVIRKPEEAEVALPVIPVDTIGAVRITIHPGAAPGVYTTTISGGPGKTFDLITLVRNEPPAPFLTGFSPAEIFPGTELHLYGYGFGGAGELLFRGEPMETLSWGEQEIVFIVPGDEGGDLRVIAEGGGSNLLPLVPKKRGFSIRPGLERLELAPGESRTLPLSVSGYADMVFLTTELESGGELSAELDRAALKPNGLVNLTLKVKDTARKGVRRISVRGRSQSYEAAALITLEIRGSLTIDEGPLPQAFAGVSYYAKLESGGSAGETQYQIVEGELPPGLELNRQGEIRGRPAQTGHYQITIEGKDEAARTGRARFVITVLEEAWAQGAKNGGRSRSAGMELPAEKREEWSFDGEEPAVLLLAAEERILGLFPGGIRAVGSAGGGPGWAIPGAYQGLIYAGARVYALTDQAVMEARDIKTGALLWSREGILSMSGNDTLILAGTGGACLVIDAARGALIEKLEIHPQGDLVWLGNNVYSIEEKRLKLIYGSGPSWESEDRIYAVAADAGGFAAASEKALILLDRELGEVARIPRGNRPGVQLALGDDAVLVGDGGLVCEYRREDLGLSWVREEAGALALGSDKAVIAGPRGLRVLNRHTGALIWEDERPFLGLALYREKIYAAGGEGRISAFGGPANLSPPDTVIQISPASPDGNNGWYVTKPALRILGSDRETYAAELKMAQDDEDWQDAAESLILDDGEHRIRAYAVDSQGLRGPEVLALIRVDTEAPESEYTPSSPEPENGWYRGPVTLSLEARDELSGLDRIISSRGIYTGEIVFAEQGVHNFTWYALDRAGNQENPRHREIRIDYEAPFTEIKASQDRGISEVTISVRDRISGAAFIEYRINDGPAERYREPLVFMREGRYEIGYRGVDQAGNYEPWRSADIWVSPNLTGVSLISDPSVNGTPRRILYHARNGMPLLGLAGRGEGFDPAAPEALSRLPPYALGAEYLLWEEGDLGSGETAGVRFRTTRDAVVYLVLDPAREAPAGWSFVEERAGINGLYYPRGSTVYMRRYTGGSWVELSLRGEPAPPLILAQEWGSVLGEIHFRAPSGEDAPLGPGGFETGTDLTLEAQVSPWTYSRRLPLRKRWLVNDGTGWFALEGNRYTLPDTSGEGFLRFRLELYTPDGRTEYQTERTVYLTEKNLD